MRCARSTRRALLGLVGGALLSPLAAWAQQARKPFQIGYVGNSTLSAESALVEGFRLGLRERGYTEGRDVVVHFRWAEGNNQRVSAIIAEFIGLKVDAMVTSGTLAAVAAKKATTAIPVVMASAGDPVNSGIVASLARPGGNITGLSSLYTDLEGKRLEILRELVPRLGRLAVLTNPANPFTQLTLKGTRAAAEALRMTTQVHEVRAAEEFEPVFEAIAKTKPDALAVLADRPFFFSNRAHIVRLAARHRLPAIYPFPEFAEDGGLVYYGPSFVDMFRRAGTYVDRILKGAKPGELPIEQPTKFEFLINGKTAKALGLKIPQSLLLRAERVIE